MRFKETTNLAWASLWAGLMLTGCGGGGGGGGSDPTLGASVNAQLHVVGPSGRMSQTPDEANESKGTNPPAFLANMVSGMNHWFRIVFPFDVRPTTLLSKDVLTDPFSNLNGNVTVTDAEGNHLPGLAMINGIDAFGKNHKNDVGFPVDPDPNDPAVNRNLGKNVFLYVADIDRKLSTFAAFGFLRSATNPNDLVETQTAEIGPEADPSARVPIDTVRLTLSEVNFVTMQAAWTFNILTATEVRESRPPFVVSVIAETRDPTDPTNASSADFASSFLVRLSEPAVPESVGNSAEYAKRNGLLFGGNVPLPDPLGRPTFPAPNSGLTSSFNVTSPLFIPFDCTPVNKNNLQNYRIRPLIHLPPESGVQFLERAVSNNVNGQTGAQSAVIDLAGNFYDGQSQGDTDGNGIPEGDGMDHTKDFTVGPGPGIVNIPVTPEVAYFLPSTGRGIGALDLNGRGFTTNTPGANAGIREQASIITRRLNANLQQILNLVNGIALLGYPCDTLICAHNQYQYPVGTGGFPYGDLNGDGMIGPGDTPGWSDPFDLGNPGTAVPGINEMSSGFETICKDSNGEVILTGDKFGVVGTSEDLIVGEFLDTIYFDTQNFGASSAFHFSIYMANPLPVPTLGRNCLSDPPSPNPPPTRFWAGLRQLDVLIDQADPVNTAFVIEGEEVFTGARAGQTGFQWLQPNPTRFDAPDTLVIPTFAVGPGVHSSTAVYTFSSRQQIGNFLYATDTENKLLHAINSNTMRVISSIPLPDPTGLSISPAGDILYVSNAAFDLVSVIPCNPFLDNFHREIARIRVGSGPRALAVQPENEDIYVCNFLGDSISIVDQQSLTVRKTISALINAPFDIALTPRQQVPAAPNPFGWACGIFFGYVSNFGGNNVLVIESGPDGPQGIGYDNVLGEIPTGDDDPPILSPRGCCSSPFFNPQGLLAGGVFVAHRDDLGFGQVSHIQFTDQAIFGPLPRQAPPGFFIPPGFLDRVFEVTGLWGADDKNRLAGFQPTDVVLADFASTGYHMNSAAPNFGGPGLSPPKPEQTGFTNSHSPIRAVGGGMIPAWTPDRLYVSFQDRDVIQALDPSNAGIVLNTSPGTGTGGVKKLCTYFEQ